MKKLILIAFLALGITSSWAQRVDWKKVDAALKTEENAFKKQYKPTQVLLVGTFHLDFPNRDDHKVDPKKQFDVLSTERQQEVLQVVEIIAKFKPTRIYVESLEQRQRNIDSLYKAYKAGKYTLPKNEKYQIGFRAAAKLGHARIYAVDDDNFAKDNSSSCSLINELWNDVKLVDSAKSFSWFNFYKRLWVLNDSIALKNTLLETLLILNDQKSINYANGIYLVGGFNTTDDKGPDALAVKWYSRNLRIFNNILKTGPKPEDRIMVLYGSGHVPILQHLFEGSPEFELVPLRTVVKQAKVK